MPRLFQEHKLRPVTLLDGLWNFAFLGDMDVDDVDITSIKCDSYMPVPACFDAMPQYAGKRGLVAYRKEIYLDEAARHRLVFDTVHHWGRVLFDGTVLHDHVGGFTQFTVDLPQSAPGSHELVVLVDNRLDYDHSPLHLDYFDWYHYGGISGSVSLHHLPESWIDRVTITVDDLTSRNMTMSIRYGTIKAQTLPLSIAIDDHFIIDEEVALSEGNGVLNYHFNLPEAALWSPNDPHLHMAAVQLGTDDLYERFGIRKVEAKQGQILINGEPQLLLGFNRHQSHPQFGYTIPQNIDYSDLMLLRDMGCNFIRGSHYPQTRSFLDLCDELGFMMWVESIGWGHTVGHLTDPHFVNAQHAHIAEMIAMSENHPSIILWGILNEGYSYDEKTTPTYAALLGQIREEDPTRPVTYACNYPFTDAHLDLVDVVSINQYPGWYQGELEDVPQLIDDFINYVDEHGQADKPIIISEIGAGAIYGWRDSHHTRWSEGYQSALLETVIKHLFFDRDRVCGLAIWQYHDIRTTQLARMALARPRDFNNKGVLDEYRRPKEAYQVVKRLFTELNSK
ncbi:hypothetical protein G4Y79_14055 [Phototrophicus methaneseepsis]|uniref:Glycoside hydrolase family 2 catalytic domain-containing protein n=1 Tax=Phototrophicus methaneseepsis TaxID=2710758 RepID=A0A7S8E5P0_9CHLR|nr:glycoside hydrolase family 2 TIM barrel-domain containing protein [Phototrophicus methaneseepsis]QPC80831.1 hypothetical protein G4Y79_14055 [Phototrophicus methaneseepsis]